MSNYASADASSKRIKDALGTLRLVLDCGTDPGAVLAADREVARMQGQSEGYGHELDPLLRAEVDRAHGDAAARIYQLQQRATR
ncbi:MAG TPA: hypothetical protein VGM19_12075 [Armatimonadota bacterium]|jgi:hypothetical protein